MKDMIFFGISVAPIVYLPVAYVLWVAVLLLAKKLFYIKIRNLAAHTATKMDDIFLEALNMPLILFILASGVFVLQNTFGATMPSDILNMVNVTFKAIVIVALVMFFEKFLNGLVSNYFLAIHALQGSLGMIKLVIRILVVGIGFLILLDNFGVSIAPILASLGIGSLAVALALQPTLENFFSGIQLIIDKPISIGQFIKLESGEEGIVENISWRSTWVRTLSNNIIVLPNKALVNSRIMNYHYPEKEMAVVVKVGVDYGSDLSFVEKVTLEVAKDAMQAAKGAVRSFDPVIRFHTLNDSSIDLNVVMRVKEFTDMSELKHEFIKRLHIRYKKEGIVIPFPMRMIAYAKDMDRSGRV
ncbi:MAG TPA: mechanosensitive ion channel family protein [Candidatus Omnitrophota bacterium]|nr:mechanosensitive ion channel family protein [Candidatus Omnitrophota bacterium]HPS19965.1 mechanosensitive ion channel family protein [Candidatus Omnitrophota bacterium]